MQAIRFAHLAKGVTLQGQFCNFRFAQHLQNYFKCSLRSLFTNKFVYARDARAQIRPLPWFFRLPNFVLLRAFIAGCMALYLFFIWQHILAAAVQKTFCSMFLLPGHEGLFGQIKRRFNTTVVKNPISLLNLKRHQRP